MGRYGTNLKNQIQIVFQTGSVTYGNEGILILLYQIISGYCFFYRTAGKCLTAGEIDKIIRTAQTGTEAGSGLYGFSAPVPGMLMHSGKNIKDSTFSDIRISH